MFKIILISIPVLFIVGSLLHYAYQTSNFNKIVGFFSPVNESIFEHSKLLLFPLTVFWLILFIFEKDSVNYNSYFFAMLISIVISIITMISFYYTYTGISGKNYEFMNILDLLVSLIMGQLIANHIFTYSNNINYIFSIITIISIIICFIYLTFKPLKIPLFYDKKSKQYGINKKYNHKV